MHATFLTLFAVHIADGVLAAPCKCFRLSSSLNHIWPNS